LTLAHCRGVYGCNALSRSLGVNVNRIFDLPVVAA
jgi:hypothetical protein